MEKGEASPDDDEAVDERSEDGGVESSSVRGFIGASCLNWVVVGVDGREVNAFAKALV